MPPSGESVSTPVWLDKLGVFSLRPYVIRPTLTLINFQSIVSYTKFQYVKKCMERFLFPNVNQSGLQVFCTF